MSNLLSLTDTTWTGVNTASAIVFRISLSLLVFDDISVCFFLFCFVLFSTDFCFFLLYLLSNHTSLHYTYYHACSLVCWRETISSVIPACSKQADVCAGMRHRRRVGVKNGIKENQERKKK